MILNVNRVLILRNWIKVVLYLICQIQIIRYILWIEILMMLCIGKEFLMIEEEKMNIPIQQRY